MELRSSMAATIKPASVSPIFTWSLVYLSTTYSILGASTRLEAPSLDTTTLEPPKKSNYIRPITLPVKVLREMEL